MTNDHINDEGEFQPGEEIEVSYNETEWVRKIFGGYEYLDENAERWKHARKIKPESEVMTKSMAQKQLNKDTAAAVDAIRPGTKRCSQCEHYFTPDDMSLFDGLHICAECQRQSRVLTEDGVSTMTEVVESNRENVGQIIKKHLDRIDRDVESIRQLLP